MIIMAMSYQDVIRMDLFNIHGFRQRIWLYKRVEQQTLAVNFHRKTGMAIIFQIHRILI